ncbi:MAG: response regulator [Planctomycetota bacterium]|nr:MAG: response regulator [Planctomycetota bacterium]
MTDTPATILVVDDEAHITRVVSLKLRNAGYTVLTAADGEEGLEAALQHTPDLIITDMQMPYLTGLEMARRLREHRATAGIPLIMLTARGFGLTPDDMAETNIKKMMSKPFGPRDLLRQVEVCLGGGEDEAAEAA